MKNRYLISYDIAEPARWQRVYKVMQGTGSHLQYSVFQCDLSEREREALLSDLLPLVHSDEDQLLIIDLGPCGGQAETCIRALGRPYKPTASGPVIL